MANVWTEPNLSVSLSSAFSLCLSLFLLHRRMKENDHINLFINVSVAQFHNTIADVANISHH